MTSISKSKKAVLISLLLIIPLVLAPQSLANNTTEVNTFTGGVQSLTIQSDGSNTSNDLQLELTRNVTYQDASFVVKFENPSQSPGSVSINNSFGDKIWEFNSPGYGSLGSQNSFQSGYTYDIAMLNNSSRISTPILLPTNAGLQTSSVNVTFTPQIDGHYVPVGSVTQMELGNSNNDNMSDAFVLSTDNATTGVNTGFAVVESSNTNHTYSLTNWTATCATSEVMRVADLNNDSYDDVVTFQIMNNTICIHYFNQTSLTYDPEILVHLANDPMDLQIADLNVDGKPDFVSIHGPAQNGSVSLSLQITSSLFVEASNLPIFKWNSNQNRANLRSMKVGNFFSPLQNQTFLLVSDDNDDATLVYYDSQSKGLMSNMTQYRNMSSESVGGDIDGDGDIDFISPYIGESSIHLNNGTGWIETKSNQVIETRNATIADHNNDGIASLFFPNPMVSDGNPATIEGVIQFNDFHNSGILATNPSPLQPYSQPSDVLFSDLNNDKVMEQFVLAGESSQGVFIGAWHNLSIDADLDGSNDLSVEGYSSSTIQHLGVLTLSDSNDLIKTSFEYSLPPNPSITDGYDVEMQGYSIMLSSNSIGIANVSDLEINYDIEFLVTNNPGLVGSLTNSLNLEMEAGIGQFNVTLPVETSQPGSFEVVDLSLISTPGAPNITLPPDPVLTSTVTLDNVTIEWQPISEFGPNLVEFLVYKSTSVESINYSTPEEIVVNQNYFVDESVSPGSTYVYVLRSIHLYGVTSNFSSPIEVYVPYPSPPTPVTNVQLIDLDISTQSSPLKVTWEENTDLHLVSEYKIYVAKSSFSPLNSESEILTTENYTIDGVSFQPVATVPSSVLEYEIDQTSSVLNGGVVLPSEPIQDGIQYWVAVAAVDGYGNATGPLPFAGPTIAFNNTYINSQLEIIIESGPAESENHILESTSPMKITLHAYYLDGNGTITAIENADLELNLTYGEEQYLLSGESDSSGQWIAIDVENLHDSAIPQSLLNFSANLTGIVNIQASMNAIEIIDTQPYASVNAVESISTGMFVELVGPQSPVDVDANAAIDVNISLIALDSSSPAHQASLEGTTISWKAFNNNSQEPLSTGSETIDSGKIRIASTFEDISRIEFSVDSEQRIFFGTAEITLMLNPYSVPNQNNETNQNETEWVPTSIQPVEIECEVPTLLTNQPSSDDPIECNIKNPNPFSVELEIFVTESPPLFKSPNDVTIEANGTVLVSFDPKYDEPLWDRQDDANVEKEFTIRALTSATVYELSVSKEDIVVWIADIFVTTEPTSDGEEQSSSDAVLWGGIGAGAIVLLIVGLILYRRASADFEDESFYQEDEIMLEENDEPIEIPTGKPLDEFEDVVISDQPEKKERPSDSLISEVENTLEEIIEEEPVEEDPENDDDISVDEFGTEWYEDEVGTWWFREAGEQDWSEYNE